MSAGSRSACAVGVVGAAALAAAAWPITFTACAVVLLAGPHAAIELRYGLARTPARLGPLRRFFTLTLAGLALLSGAVIAIHLAVRAGALSAGAPHAYAAWLTGVVLWTAALARERACTPPRRDWTGAAPAVLAALALAWLAPIGAMLALVYLHPLVALAVLDRELARARPEALRAYRTALGAVPFAVAWVLYAGWTAGPAWSGGGALAERVVLQSGSAFFPDVPPLALVAAHGLLEVLHYLAWLIAIPLASRPHAGRVLAIPLERRSPVARRAVRVLLAASLALVAFLWWGFATEPALTWDVYFTFAIVHVLAEIPMLLRLL